MKYWYLEKQCLCINKEFHWMSASRLTSQQSDIGNFQNWHFELLYIKCEGRLKKKCLASGPADKCHRCHSLILWVRQFDMTTSIKCQVIYISSI